MDYFKILKLPKSATREEIKRAYKKYALKCHPDRNKDGAEEFITVTNAYRALMKITAKNKKVEHDLSFVKGRLNRDKIWAPDFHLFRRPKMDVKNLPCDSCAGTGKLMDKPGASITCPECHGLGVKTKINI